jgi:hypothetical protein
LLGAGVATAMGASPISGMGLTPDLASPLRWARLEANQALAHVHGTISQFPFYLIWLIQMSSKHSKFVGNSNKF